MSTKYWLMKAEPDSRIVKGKDVKFSVDDFEQVQTTAWEGVRNPEARNLMKEMKAGDKVLFYHSNCKTPGIAAFAEVSKESYPDYTAWDSEHPYFDAKTDKENPKWFMVDVTLTSRAQHFIPLSLLRRLAEDPEPPQQVAYIGTDGVKAIQQMALINRGRLSVQRVEEKTWGVIEMLAERGGWDDLDIRPGKKRSAASVAKKKGAKAHDPAQPAVEDEEDKDDVKVEQPPSNRKGRKRKAEDDPGDEASLAAAPSLRRSTRQRK